MNNLDLTAQNTVKRIVLSEEEKAELEKTIEIEVENDRLNKDPEF